MGMNVNFWGQGWDAVAKNLLFWKRYADKF